MDTEENKDKKARVKRTRSPNYPFYSIKTCVDLLDKFVKNNKGFSKAHIDYTNEYMGFTQKSTRGARAISSMLGYGLFENDGSGNNRAFWPSDLAKKIYQAGSESTRIKLIQKATLNDSETYEVWNRYQKALPGRSSLEKWLMADRNYSDRGAKRFAFVVMETYDFAQLAQSQTQVTLEDQDKPDDDVSGIPGSNIPPSGIVDYPIPLDGGKRFVYLRAPGDLTEADFDYIIQVINVLKIGLSKKDQ